MGSWRVKTKQILKEPEEGEKIILPGLDCILSRASPDRKTLVSAIVNAGWIQKEFTLLYDAVLEEHLIKINGQENTASKTVIHCLPTVLTDLCGKGSESLQLDCPPCPEQLIQLFRVLVFWDDNSLKPTMVHPQKLRVMAKLGDSLPITRQLLHKGDVSYGLVTEQVHTVLNTVTTIKRRKRSVSIPYCNFLRFSGAEKLPEVFAELREMIAYLQAQRVQSSSIEARASSTSLKL